MKLALDHLVIAARTLAEGLDWCDATLGLRPDAGGRHAFMGTHNQVFSIGSPAFPGAYAEIIAIDPEAPAPVGHARWFDLDDATLQRTLVADGPQLVHWVARCGDIAASRAALRAAGVDPGEIQSAERMTPQGLLRWRISVRSDGRRTLAGAVPALIEWGDVHPTDSMADSGVLLQSVHLGRLPASLQVALHAALPTGIEPNPDQGAPPLSVRLIGPRGPVTLSAPIPTA